VSHGGGAIPYQLGRFEAGSLRQKERFSTKMRKLYFDTVLYGAECPGVGSAVNPDTGRTMDDILPIIDGFDWLPADQKHAILHGNAERLFKLA
jgi:OH-DDVA meta-cleavage compound hydrolase